MKRKSKSKIKYGFKIYSPSGNLIAKGTPKKNINSTFAMAKREGRQELYDKRTPIGSRLEVHELGKKPNKKVKKMWDLQ